LQQDLQIDPGREFGVTLLRLKRQLSIRKIGVLIDNLEPALDQSGRIISSQRGYFELLRVLTDQQLIGITLITSRDRLCEIDLNLAHYRLSGLDLDTWQTYFSHRQINTTAMMISPLHHTYGGNAKAMEIIAGNISTDLDNNINSYSQIDGNTHLIEIGLKQLIANQFDRLQILDPSAYKLLCRAGCYRYQDLSRINIDALLSLLWDVEPAQRLQVVDSLKNRSLIEFYRGQYWLHPAIRSEAITRLKGTDDWVLTCQQAAEYWTTSVPKIIDLTDAITALEAYYHYLECDDFGQAAQVLIQPRDNQWRQLLPLASNLYRMGSIHPPLTAIVQILPHLSPDRITVELSNILGDLYWIVGRIHEAITTQQDAIECANIALAKADLEDLSHDVYCLNVSTIDSCLSIGLYYIDLWELTKARDQFRAVIKIANGTVHQRWVQKATVCLALVQSYLNNSTETEHLLTEIEPLIIDHQWTSEWTGSSAYFLHKIGQTYSNLGEYDRAEVIFQQTLIFCQAGNYLQTQGRTLTSLGQLCRRQDHLKIAQQHHLEAIEILDRLGAKCDLAEAYYQAGLTWHQAGDLDRSHIYWDLHAHRLFMEIGAPLQIAKMKAKI
jgi:tetratricopeptide (TPR) repeat protein